MLHVHAHFFKSCIWASLLIIFCQVQLKYCFSSTVAARGWNHTRYAKQKLCSCIVETQGLNMHPPPHLVFQAHMVKMVAIMQKIKIAWFNYSVATVPLKQL